MNVSLTDAIKEAYASCPLQRVVLETLEIRQLTVQPSIFLVRSRKPFQASDEDGFPRNFLPSGFSITLPSEDDQGFRSLNVTIDNVGREVSDFITLAKGSPNVPVAVVYRPYLSDDTSGPQMNPPLILYLTQVAITATSVQGTATFMDVVNKKWPTELYVTTRFPGLA